MSSDSRSVGDGGRCDGCGDATRPLKERVLMRNGSRSDMCRWCFEEAVFDERVDRGDRHLRI